MLSSLYYNCNHLHLEKNLSGIESVIGICDLYVESILYLKFSMFSLYVNFYFLNRTFILCGDVMS